MEGEVGVSSNSRDRLDEGRRTVVMQPELVQPGLPGQSIALEDRLPIDEVTLNVGCWALGRKLDVSIKLVVVKRSPFAARRDSGDELGFSGCT